MLTYMRPERWARAEKVAANLFGGNLSEMLDQGIDALITQRSHRDALIADAIMSAVSGEQTDDSIAAEHGHLLLAALFGEGDAQAIEQARRQFTHHRGSS